MILRGIILLSSLLIASGYEDVLVEVPATPIESSNYTVQLKPSIPVFEANLTYGKPFLANYTSDQRTSSEQLEQLDLTAVDFIECIDIHPEYAKFTFEGKKKSAEYWYGELVGGFGSMNLMKNTMGDGCFFGSISAHNAIYQLSCASNGTQDILMRDGRNFPED